MSRSKIKLLLIFFIIFSVASLAYLSYAVQIPLEETKTINQCTYTQKGTYGYIAKLKPSLIYDNKSTLSPGEGTIYIPITEHINITFTYIFECSLNANTTIKYATNEIIVTPRWTKQIFALPQKVLVDASNRTSINVDVPTIFTLPTDTRSIGWLVTSINNEIGVATGNYNVTLITTMILHAETEVGVIDDPFTATLTIAFLRGSPQGDVISLENLQTIKTGSITQSEKIYNTWAVNHQYASYITSAVAFIGLVASAYFYIKTKPLVTTSQTEKFIQELIEPYEDIIIETIEEPLQKGQTRISVRTLSDLVKIADTLSKPIIHFRKLSLSTTEEPTDFFYVMDEMTRYEYKIAQSEITAQKLAQEEEED